MNSVVTIKTLKKLAALPSTVRTPLLEPHPDDSKDPVHYIFRHSITHEGIDYQLDWAAIAKHLAKDLEVCGEPGGWIYALVGGTGIWKGTLQGAPPICQGWVAYAKKKYPFIASAARIYCGDVPDYRNR